VRILFIFKVILALRFVTLISLSSRADAGPIDDIIKSYLQESKKIDSNLKEFDAAKGKDFYHAKQIRKDGKKTSCETCHTPDPKMPGKSQAGKAIEPMAPIVNPKRFTDKAKVEKWFKRNCMDVYERPCTALEKGHFIKYLQSIK